MSFDGLRTCPVAGLLLAVASVGCGDRFQAVDSVSPGAGGQIVSSTTQSGGAAGSSDPAEDASSGTGGEGGVGGGSGGAAGPGGRAGASGSAGGSVDAGVDAAVCHDPKSVDSCGVACKKCTAPGDRTVPTCNGTSCGFSCRNGDPMCSDGTCSRLLWNFESGALDGIVLRESSGHPLAVRTFDGTMALAVDVDQLNEIPEVSFTLPICVSGTVDLRQKKLNFRVYFQGTQSDFFVQSAVPVPQANAYLDQTSATSGKWFAYSSPMSKSAFGGSATMVTIQLGSLGGQFTGTIWLDDFKIQ